MLEHRLAAARSAPLFRKFARERFDGVEHCRDLPLVTRQDDAFRKRIADDQNPLSRQSLEIDRPTGWDLLVAVLGQLDRRRLFLLLSELAADLSAEGAEQVAFLCRAQPGHHHDPITEQRNDAAASAEGQGRGGQHVAVPKPRRVDSLAHENSMRRYSTIARK